MKLPAPQNLLILLWLCGPILAQTQNSPKIIDAIEIRGARNIPPETLKAIIGTKPGDAYNEEAIGRDAAALWKIGSFSDIQLTNQTGPGGGAIVRFTLMQKQ